MATTREARCLLDEGQEGPGNESPGVTLTLAKGPNGWPCNIPLLGSPSPRCMLPHNRATNTMGCQRPACSQRRLLDTSRIFPQNTWQCRSMPLTTYGNTSSSEGYWCVMSASFCNAFGRGRSTVLQRLVMCIARAECCERHDGKWPFCMVLGIRIADQEDTVTRPVNGPVPAPPPPTQTATHALMRKARRDKPMDHKAKVAR